ncbi:MAG: EFR1 family ferrodoxin [Bacteroidales bacterium]|nr:EFR1 family ferrodoxin [Bacteroidales bacterium]
MIFYFSGCGNSRFIAKSISKALNERLLFIPEEERSGKFDYDLVEGESLGFVFPIYSWQTPRLVVEFVKKLRLVKKPTYVWMAVTCGDNGGYADRLFSQQLQESLGLMLNANYCFVMPNTYVNMAGMSVDKPELAQKKIEAAKAHLPEVIQNIKDCKQAAEMRRGIFPRFKTNVIGKNFYRWVSDEPFFSTDDCISCGKCVEVCPFHNITLEDGRPKWHGKCTTCNACYHYCPKHAIQYGKASKGKGQYHFPE